MAQAKKIASKMQLVTPIDSRIYVAPGQKIMLDSDLATLYPSPTSRLNEAVKRNLARFPRDFMFQLTNQEAASLISQTATSKPGRGGRRKLPYAFTEHGVAMLSSILNTERAIRVSIMIMRTFIRMREMMIEHKDIAAKIEKLEHKQDRVASASEILVEDIDRLSDELKQMKKLPSRAKQKIGFALDKRKS